MIAVGTNILLYTHREDTRHHAIAKKLLKRLAEGAAPWAIAWPCIYEFIRLVTHPRYREALPAVTHQAEDALPVTHP